MLTAQQLENAANAAMDFNMSKGKVFSQSLQDKPLLDAMLKNTKTFPGGKENIAVRVKGEYTTAIQGYDTDDTVEYGNPANIKKCQYPWKEIHWGIKVTLTELKQDGITITDTALGKGESEHSMREETALANILEDKIEDMKEGGERGMNLMLWRDGTQDSKLVPGIRSFIVNDPTSATVIGGIDQSANTWWRNRASLAIASNSTTWSAQPLVRVFQQEVRQLRRYGSPKHRIFAGSDLMDAFEMELRTKGNYTLDGWAKGGKEGGRIDASVADLAFKGIAIEYDPTLDDEGLSKYAFWIDTNAIKLMPMDGEEFKNHNPARPADKYVLYRARTWTGGLVCRQRNTSGVYSIA